MTTHINLTCILMTGIGATAAIDLWAIARRRLHGTPLPNYALVGRLIARLAPRRLRHERAIGWIAHYFIGIAFASILPAIWGNAWFRAPTLAPALAVGIVTVAAPFLILQPAMGAGIAASRTPRPGAARLQSFVTHGFFGLGLYAAGLIVNRLLIGE